MPTVSVQIHTHDDDAEEIDRLARQLRQELLGLEVDTVTIARAEHELAGAKGDAVTLGTLLVTGANSAVLVSLCQLVRAWVTRARDRRIVVKQGERTLEITGANAAQHQQVIDAFLAGMQSSAPTADRPDTAAGGTGRKAM